jgi:hypothetical protein
LKHIFLLIFSFLLAIGLVACGGQDRSSLAKQTVQTYWTSIEKAKMKTAWNILSPGQQQANAYGTWSTNLLDFLKTTDGIVARVGEPVVSGNNASVPVTIRFNKAPNPSNDQHGYQHLYWDSGAWRITDDSGTLTKSKT